MRSSNALLVGCAPQLPIQRLQAFLGALYTRVPEIEPRVTHLAPADQLERLASGELDLGLLHSAPDSDRLRSEPLFAGEPLAAYLPHDHSLGPDDEPVGPEDLREKQLVTYPRAASAGLHDRLLARIEQAGFSFSGVREASSADARDLILAVADGSSVALLPSWLEDATDAAGLVACRPLAPPVAMPDALVVWRADETSRLEPVLAVVRELRSG
jgi:DNA-binding transcriptional LysR family regulator